MKILSGEVAREQGPISTQDFYDKYIVPRKPVVLHNQFPEWTCYKKWNVDYFESNYKEKQLWISKLHANGLSHPPNFEVQMNFGNFINLLREQEQTGAPAQGHDNVYYLQQCPAQYFGALLKEDYAMPDLFSCSKYSLFGANSVFLGTLCTKND